MRTILRDCDRQVHAHMCGDGEPGVPWEVLEWGGAYFLVRANGAEAVRFESLEEAVEERGG